MEETVLQFLEENEREMFALLRELVLIQSYSFNRIGNDLLVRHIAETLGRNRLTFERVEQSRFGDCLLAASPAAGGAESGDGGRRGILLVGHTDTVFPEDTPFHWYREDEANAYGPGVIDMKGGLVTGIFALKALDRARLLEEIPIRFLFNTDEEVGSQESRNTVYREAERAAFGFVLEAGGLNGEVVTGRKGRLGFRVDVRGLAGHAAQAGPDKASAVLELAHRTVALEALNSPERGVTVNVGRVGGGIGPNTVAEEASAEVDVRFRDADGEAWVREGIARTVGETVVPGTTVSMEMLSERDPMFPGDGNRALFRVAEECGRRLGVPLVEEFRSGVSDANLIAGRGTPVIDGLGPCGEFDHSDREYMLKSSMLERTKLFTLILLESWRRYEKGELFKSS
jgi:glutamate carboxypeptidase